MEQPADRPGVGRVAPREKRDGQCGGAGGSCNSGTEECCSSGTEEAEDAELDALLGGSSLEGPATKKDFANLRRLCHRRLQRQNKAHAEAQRQMRERHLQEVEELKVAHMRQLMSNGIALQGP